MTTEYMTRDELNALYNDIENYASFKSATSVQGNALEIWQSDSFDGFLYFFKIDEQGIFETFRFSVIYYEIDIMCKCTDEVETSN